MFGNLGVEICVQGRLGLTPRDFGVSFRFARPGNHSWQLPQCMLCEDFPQLATLALVAPTKKNTSMPKILVPNECKQGVQKYILKTYWAHAHHMYINLPIFLVYLV